MTQKYTEAKKEGNRRWDAANLDRISIALNKGKKDIIKVHAENCGESVNSFINRAIDEVIENEGDYKIVDEATLERRFRYRLKVHGMTLHKEKDEYGKSVYYITDEVETGRPDEDDQYRWLTFSDVESYCAELAEKDAEFFAEQRAERRARGL